MARELRRKLRPAPGTTLWPTQSHIFSVAWRWSLCALPYIAVARSPWGSVRVRPCRYTLQPRGAVHGKQDRSAHRPGSSPLTSRHAQGAAWPRRMAAQATALWRPGRDSECLFKVGSAFWRNQSADARPASVPQKWWGTARQRHPQKPRDGMKRTGRPDTKKPRKTWSTGAFRVSCEAFWTLCDSFLAEGAGFTSAPSSPMKSQFSSI